MGPPAAPTPEESNLAEAFLEVAGGPEKGKLLPLSRGTTTLGRSPGNTHVIADATMSRQHAKVFVRADRHWVADLNSSHGTFVNGAKVTLQTLVDGDEVKVGSTVLRYRATKTLPKAAPASPAAPAAPSAPAAPAAKAAGMSTGSFELELPADAPAASPATRGPLPPLATNYRRALTPEGEDPFALEEPAEESANAPASSPAGGPAPAIEMRGETARHFASRGAAQPASVSASAGVRPLHAPPPLAQTARRRGTFTFLRDELDQRGPLARTVAAVFAIAAAGALFWLALRVFDSAPKSAPTPPEEGAPTGPSRPVLPTRR